MSFHLRVNYALANSPAALKYKGHAKCGGFPLAELKHFNAA